MNLSKCEKSLWSLCKGKKAPHSSFYEDEWFLDSGASTHFTPFESDFVNMILDNYGWVETANLKALLFIVTSGTILIKHKSLILRKKLPRLLYQNYGQYIVSLVCRYIFSGQILQSELRVEDNKNGSTCHDKSGNAILLAISNLWSNIQIVRTYILKHNVPNFVSLVTRYLDFALSFWTCL